MPMYITPGWYNFELRIAYPLANVRYNLMFKSPWASGFSSYYGFRVLGPSGYDMPDPAQNTQLSKMWQVGGHGYLPWFLQQ
jgi:hypothetical protein